MRFHCCCNINENTRIRIFLPDITKLPGRVSGFSPLPGPGTPTTPPQRQLPCRDELLTGPKTGCLILCQGRHGAAGILAASWIELCIMGLKPFNPSSSSSLLSPSFFFQDMRIVMQSWPSRVCGRAIKHTCVRIIFVQSSIMVRDTGSD